SVLGFHLVGILAFSLSTQIFFFLATLVLSGFDPLVSVSQPFTRGLSGTFPFIRFTNWKQAIVFPQKVGSGSVFGFHSYASRIGSKLYGK
ncbi:MAG: hypothetical protein EWV67_09425, partial [Microcystis sp. M_QC_C_20170808_M2Col]